MLSYSSVEEQRREKRKRSSNKRGRKKTKGNAETVPARQNEGEDSADLIDDSALATIIPVQWAIHKDLIEARALFRSVLSDNEASRQTERLGCTFDCFRKVSQSTKLSALHRFAPPRCDVASFSQVIYASCLDLLEGDVVTPSYDMFVNSAFAIFALYMLYKTNPLPTAPPDSGQSLLSALPMGLTHRENPKLVFRRNFRPYIRLEPNTYAKLLQLRHVCISTKETLKALALDIGSVLDRLWPHLDLVCYQGPMGLHGLSQRQQLAGVCSLVATRLLPTHDEGKCDSTHGDEIKLNEDNEDSIGDSGEMLELQVRMQTYLFCRGGIRLPPPNISNRFDRIRGAMQPLARSEVWEQNIKKSLECSNVPQVHTEQLDETRSPLSDAAHHGTGTCHGGINNTYEQQRQVAADSNVGEKNGGVLTAELFSLRLPPGVPGTMQESLKSATQSLINRHGVSMFQLTSNAERSGDASTIGPASTAISVIDASVSSIVGRGALKILMQAVEGSAEAGDVPAKGSSASVDSSSAVGRGALEVLMQSVQRDERDAASKKASALGSSGSVGSSSAVGRGALEALMKAVQGDANRKKAPARGSSASVGTSSAVGRGALEALMQAVQGDTNSKKTPARRSSASVGPSSAVGRGALEALIQAVQEGEASSKKAPVRGCAAGLIAFLDADPDDDDKCVNPKKTGRGHKKHQILEDDISDVSLDDAMDEVSRGGGSTVGKRALEDLLVEVSRTRSLPSKPKETRKLKQRHLNSNKKEKVENAPSSREKKQPVDHETSEESFNVYSSDDTDEFAGSEEESSPGHGQAALKALLAKALK